jgi:N-acetylglucosaminyl-diphospho-decaprenol L-rhamnosyltransferase
MTSGVPTTISVVVVNWNGGELLLDCLRSLVEDAETVPGTEIVLVDNASTDGSVERAEKQFRGLTCLRRATNDGFAAGVDAGIRASSGEFVVLVNNDARVLPGYLRAIVAPMTGAGGEDVAAVTGRVLLAGRFRPVPAGEEAPSDLVGVDGRRWRRAPDGDQLVNSTGNVVTRSGNGRDRDWLAPADQVRPATDVFGFNGGSVALRRRALDDVGPFETRLFMYYEDTELSWRLRRAGWRIEHAPAAVTEHQHAASSGTATAFFQVHNTRNRLVVALAHAPWAVVLRALARSLVRLATGPHRDRTARALAQAAVLVPFALGIRRAVDRSATVPRREVAAMLVRDGAPD